MGAFSLADNIIKMKEHGVNGETLAATIQIFIDMGKPFANPTCPEPEEAPTPAPVSKAVCSKPCTIGEMPGTCRIESGGMVICLPAGASGVCAAGQTTCGSTDSVPRPRPRPRPADIRRPQCVKGTHVFLTSHRGQQL